MSRKAIRALVKEKGIEGAMRVPKGTLTPKMKRFAEAVALGNTGADAYRAAYSNNQKPKTIGDNASRLKADSRIKTEIERIQRANELAAYHSYEGLRSIVISTLAEIATNPEEKGATRVQSVRAIGQLVGVDAFRETKRVEHVRDSGELRDQIMAQLKTMMLASDDAVDVDADSLLAELAPIESDNQNGQADSPTLPGDATFATGTPLDPLHTIPHEPSQEFSDPDSEDLDPSKDPPLSSEMQDHGGDIFGENDGVAK
jgi:phage terminase small subunit